MDKRQDGFTIIEIMVAMSIFAIVSVGFYQVLFASTRGSNTTNDIVKVSEEARLGFNRMVRDTREGNILVTPTSTEYTVEVDFDGDGAIEAVPTDPTGNYEKLTFTFNESSTGNGTIAVSNGVTSEVLVRGVDCIRKGDGTCQDLFSFSSSRLEWDANGDGVTSFSELTAVTGVGPGEEVKFIDIVSFAMVVRQGDSSEKFYAQAQLRNRR